MGMSDCTDPEIHNPFARNSQFSPLCDIHARDSVQDKPGLRTVASFLDIRDVSEKSNRVIRVLCKLCWQSVLQASVTKRC